jgi:hypothetical protein
MDTAQKLDQLAELQSALDAWSAEKASAIDALIPDEIKARIAEVEKELAPKIAGINGDIETLTAEIKAEVLAKGETAKGKYIMATWNKGRAGGWDTGKLEGFALVHPEILKAKKPDGEPTVSFRAVK